MKIFKGAKIIDMTGEKKPEEKDILVKNKKIYAIKKNIKANNKKVISLHDKYVIPGLIDSHTHLCMTTTLFELNTGIGELDNETASFFALKNAQDALKKGVTSLRDVGGQNYIDIKLKNFIKAGYIKGPRIYSAGKVITTTGGHLWKIGEIADTGEEIEKAIKRQIYKGAYLIKIIISGGLMTSCSQSHFLQYNANLLKKAKKIAHNLDRKIAGHVGNNKALKGAIEAGIDSVEHAVPENDKDLNNMIHRNIYCVPTMSTFPLWNSSEKKWDAPEFFLKKKKEQDPDQKRVLLKKAHRKGLKIIAGTDAGTPYVPFGNVPKELEIFTNCGFSNYEALESATSLASELIGDNKIGALKKDNWADMVVLKENPLNNIKTLRNPEMVISGGEIVYSNLKM